MKKINITPDTLLKCAIAAAHTAGNHALTNFARRRNVIKAFQHDVKLKLDQECQAKAHKVISKAFPDHIIMGEEDETRITDVGNAYEWIIDPIDGTVNYFHGLPLWCCSVAVRKSGKMLAGAVFAPAMRELYTATCKRPATCNGKRIFVSTTRTLAESIIMTGIDKTFDARVKPLTMFTRLTYSTQKARVYGSAAYDMCLVARGAADSYFESGIYLWDMAAAGLIVEMAGGKTELLRKPDANQRLSFIASNGKVHKQLKALLTVEAEH